MHVTSTRYISRRRDRNMTTTDKRQCTERPLVSYFTDVTLAALQHEAPAVLSRHCRRHQCRSTWEAHRAWVWAPTVAAPSSHLKNEAI